MYTAARLVCDIHDHISARIHALYWLPIKRRINYKLRLFVYPTVNGRTPSYLQDLITPSVSVPRRSTLLSVSLHDLALQSWHRKLGNRACPLLILLDLKNTVVISLQIEEWIWKYCHHFFTM